MKLVRLLSLFVLSLFVVAPVVAQKRFMPEKMERATKVDDYATTQWVEWAELKCPELLRHRQGQVPGLRALHRGRHQLPRLQAQGGPRDRLAIRN